VYYFGVELGSRSDSWWAARVAAGEAWIVLDGASMEPALSPGDRLRVAPFRDRGPARDEIVVARRGGRIVAHRVVALDGDRVVLRGDGLQSPDPPLALDDLIGRVIEVERGAHRFAPPARPARDRGDAIPFLDGAELIAGVRAGALPLRFSTTVTGGALRPFVAAGSRVTIRRDPAPPVGALVVLADGDCLAFRRVIDRRGGRSLVRADVAPFADGWFGGIVGEVELGSPLARIAARFPRAVGELGWRGAAWSARLRALARPRHLPGSFSVTRDSDEGNSLRFSLVSDGGVRCGETTLTMRDGAGVSHDTRIATPFRGRGGASWLLAAALREARARSLSRVVAWVHARNLPSLAAYRRAGFRPVGWWRSGEDPLLAAERQLVELVALTG
jgi:GNAT superfamily N-acetyltransferase